MNTKDNDALGNLKSLIWKYVYNVCVFRSDWVKSFYSSKLQRSGSTTSKSTFISSVSRVSPPVLQLQLLTAPISRPNCNNLLPRRRHEPHAVPLPHNSPTHTPPCREEPLWSKTSRSSSNKASVKAPLRCWNLPRHNNKGNRVFFPQIFFELVECKHNYRRRDIIRDRNVTFSLRRWWKCVMTAALSRSSSATYVPLKSEHVKFPLDEL